MPFEKLNENNNNHIAKGEREEVLRSRIISICARQKQKWAVNFQKCRSNQRLRGMPGLKSVILKNAGKYHFYFVDMVALQSIPKIRF